MSQGNKRRDAETQSKPPEPGCGAPADREGLFWVSAPNAGRMIAVLEGRAPFLRLRLLDPWEPHQKAAFDATQKQIELLVWLGEIELPRTI